MCATCEMQCVRDVEPTGLRISSEQQGRIPEALICPPERPKLWETHTDRTNHTAERPAFGAVN